MSAVTVEAPELLQPTSAEEAVAAFGDGAGITVLAGGTIVVPEMTHGRSRPRRVLMLGKAGLDGLAGGSTWRIGATATLAAIAKDGPEPLRTAAQRVADAEIRGQATIGGNLCAGEGRDAPRGDLQSALIAAAARVRSAGAGGERSEPVEELLASGPAGRLVLELELEQPKHAAYVSLGRRHTHAYTILSIAAAETSAGVRVAVGGCGPVAVRCPSVEAALAAGAAPAAAAEKVLDDVTPRDDALATAWYRGRILPGLVAQALSDLQGAVAR